jgi:hypothetical protein
VEASRQLASDRGLPFFTISSATGEGLDQLKQAMSAR